MARGLLVLVVIAGLFLAATSIAQRMVTPNRPVAVAHLTADFHDANLVSSVAPDVHHATFNAGDLTDVDAAPTDAALSDATLRHVSTGRADAYAARTHAHTAWLKGFDPPP